MAKFTSRLIISIFLLTMVGSVSAQYVYGVCTSKADGNWNDPNNWNNCNGNTPSSPIDSASISPHNIVITGSEKVNVLTVFESASLFIDCGASLTLNEGGSMFGVLTSHGTVDASLQTLFIENTGKFFNSGIFSNVITEGGTIQQITSICPVIGGTIVPVDKLSLLVAGTQANIQANIGWLSLAVVGIIAAGAGIALKKRSEKNNEN